MTCFLPGSLPAAVTTKEKSVETRFGWYGSTNITSLNKQDDCTHCVALYVTKAGKASVQSVHLL